MTIETNAQAAEALKTCFESASPDTPEGRDDRTVALRMAKTFGREIIFMTPDEAPATFEAFGDKALQKAFISGIEQLLRGQREPSLIGDQLQQFVNEKKPALQAA